MGSLLNERLDPHCIEASCSTLLAVFPIFSRFKWTHPLFLLLILWCLPTALEEADREIQSKLTYPQEQANFRSQADTVLKQLTTKRDG